MIDMSININGKNKIAKIRIIGNKESECLSIFFYNKNFTMKSAIASAYLSGTPALVNAFAIPYHV